MTAPRFAVGRRVRVRTDDPALQNRTPRFVRGKVGVVERDQGAMPLPENLAYGRTGQAVEPVYRVRFRQRDLWPDYQGPEGDSVAADLHEHWLEPA